MHTDNQVFIINTYVLHNALLLCEALPRELTVPRPIYEDCQTHHYALAAKVRELQGEKQAVTKEKRQVAWAKKINAVNEDLPPKQKWKGQDEPSGDSDNLSLPDIESEDDM